jgi:hypothetical protein
MPRVDAFFNKTMKKTDIVKTAREMIYNKYVLYAVFLAALFDLLYSVVKEDYLYCALFILIGFLIAFFNKNMTVILTLTMAFATILRNILRGNGLKVEGFENGTIKNPDDEVPEENANTEDSSISKKLLASETFKSEYEDKPKTTTPAKLMDDLKEKALDLQDAQKNIINGFEKIEPYMDKAETLIGDIQKTALTIQGMRTQQAFQSGK